MHYSNVLFNQREWVARGISAAVIGLVVISHQLLTLNSPPSRPAPTLIRISLAQPAPPVQEPTPVQPVQPVQPPPPPPPPPPKPPPAKPEPVQVPQPVPQSVPPTPTALPVAKPMPPMPVSNPSHEGAYIQKVRQQIERHKVYPALARNLDMSGTVEVAYVINREGRLIHVEIAASSGSKILDSAALQAVRAAVFPPMPEDAWRGDTQKQFKTKLVYSLTEDDF